MINKKESIQIERAGTGPVKVVDLIKSCPGLRRHILSSVITTLVRPDRGNEARHDYPQYFRSEEVRRVFFFSDHLETISEYAEGD